MNPAVGADRRVVARAGVSRAAPGAGRAAARRRDSVSVSLTRGRPWASPAARSAGRSRARPPGPEASVTGPAPGSGCVRRPAAEVVEEGLDRLVGAGLVRADEAGRAALDPAGDVDAGLDPAALVRHGRGVLVEGQAGDGAGAVADGTRDEAGLQGLRGVGGRWRVTVPSSSVRSSVAATLQGSYGGVAREPHRAGPGTAGRCGGGPRRGAGGGFREQPGLRRWHRAPGRRASLSACVHVHVLQGGQRGEFGHGESRGAWAGPRRPSRTTSRDLLARSAASTPGRRCRGTGQGVGVGGEDAGDVERRCRCRRPRRARCPAGGRRVRGRGGRCTRRRSPWRRRCRAGPRRRCRGACRWRRRSRRSPRGARAGGRVGEIGADPDAEAVAEAGLGLDGGRVR